MATHLSIGDFSKMTFLSVKTLRHYQDVGLLLPVSVERATGYRRYALSQVATAHVIRRLRELGMPIEDVKHVLAAPNLTARNDAIVAHLLRMERELQRTQDTVIALRKLLEAGSTSAPIEVRSVPTMRVLAIRAVIEGVDLDVWRRDAFTELRTAFRTANARRVGPEAALYSSELLEEERGEITAFIPAEGTLPVGGRRTELQLPAGDAAVIVHAGSFDTMDQSFAALGAYINEHFISVAGSIREDYVVGGLDTSDETRFRTEIAWPIFRTSSEPASQRRDEP